MSTAFVLSGGASLGAIQVGMLEALYQRAVVPDMIVGTSAGAFNGAFIASRPASVETARELAQIWQGIHRADVFPTNPLTGLLGFVGVRNHLVPDAGLRRLIRRHIAVERLEQTRVPLHVVATDVLTGREVRLSEGLLADAVMASAAIPGVLPAVQWNGRILMDGGIANNAPISHALELGAKTIYVLPTGIPCELDQPPRGALPMLLYASGLLVGRRLAADIDDVAKGIDLVVLPPPCPIAVQPTDFSHARSLIDRARADASRCLAQREIDIRRARRPRNLPSRPARWADRTAA